ncbi:hypothetical protein AJ87_24245 [Rhizobium yanglingense]|nr:hypothetical protein AJ87_24245 [Rhizobium yanglingense]
MKIVNYTVYKGNPYTRAIYSSILPEYEPVKGDIDDAILELKTNKIGVIHIHWEEHLIRHCRSVSEAKQLVAYNLARLEYFKKLGGIVLWTVHNALPHEMEFPDLFLQYRKGIALLANRILVHNAATITLLSNQGIQFAWKTSVLSHPSYLRVYTDTKPDISTITPLAVNKSILAFGLVRRYKNLERLFIDLDPTFTQQHGLHITVSEPCYPVTTMPRD